MPYLMAPGSLAGRHRDARSDSNALTHLDRRQMGERFIHGQIYRARPDVMAIVATRCRCSVRHHRNQAAAGLSSELFHRRRLPGVRTAPPLRDDRYADP